jgi:hypothetical protein
VRIAVITDKQLPKSLAGFKLKTIPWDTEKLEVENLRDYDGVIIDVESYNLLDKVFSPGVIEYDSITPMITYDVLKASPSFYIVMGDPSEIVKNKNFLELVGFSGKYVKGAGTQHGLTEAGKKSIYRNYLSDIKRYKYAYDNAFSTNSEIQSLVHRGSYDKYMTLGVPLMKTKSGYLTAFQLQGKAYYTDRLQNMVDSLTLFDGSLPTFLPSHPEGLEYGLGVLLRALKERETSNNTDEPEWTSSMTVHGQAEIDTEIGSKSDQIQNLTSEKSELEAERATLRKILEILYLGDKSLEGALKHVFRDHGYTVDDPVDSNNVEFYLKNGKQEFVVEVKSSLKPHFNKEGLRQVNEWRENEALDNGKEYKPLLILSHEYDKPLEERDVNDVIDENLVAYAVSRKIAVVTTPVLYGALQYVSEGKISKNKLADVLFKAEGLLNIEDFYSEV